jgi:mRNA interferase RelE/StbE
VTGRTYQVELTRRAERDLLALPAPILRRVIARIDALAKDPRPPGCVKLADDDVYRVRVGDHRILYQVRDRVLMILVVTIGHRRDVHRRRGGS